MKATILDLRRRMREVLQALDRHERVTILYRGRKRAVLLPAEADAEPSGSAAAHPAFGIWSGRDDLADPAAWVRGVRKRRFS